MKKQYLLVALSFMLVTQTPHLHASKKSALIKTGFGAFALATGTIGKLYCNTKINTYKKNLFELPITIQKLISLLKKEDAVGLTKEEYERKNELQCRIKALAEVQNGKIKLLAIEKLLEGKKKFYENGSMASNIMIAAGILFLLWGGYDFLSTPPQPEPKPPTPPKAPKLKRKKAKRLKAKALTDQREKARRLRDEEKARLREEQTARRLRKTEEQAARRLREAERLRRLLEEQAPRRDRIREEQAARVRREAEKQTRLREEQAARRDRIREEQAARRQREAEELREMEEQLRKAEEQAGEERRRRKEQAAEERRITEAMIRRARRRFSLTNLPTAGSLPSGDTALKPQHTRRHSATVEPVTVPPIMDDPKLYQKPKPAPGVAGSVYEYDLDQQILSPQDVTDLPTNLPQPPPSAFLPPSPAHVEASGGTLENFGEAQKDSGEAVVYSSQWGAEQEPASSETGTNWATPDLDPSKIPGLELE